MMRKPKLHKTPCQLKDLSSREATLSSKHRRINLFAFTINFAFHKNKETENRANMNRLYWLVLVLISCIVFSKDALAKLEEKEKRIRYLISQMTYDTP